MSDSDNPSFEQAGDINVSNKHAAKKGGTTDTLQVSDADTFLHDYFSDLLCVDVKTPQKRLNVSTRSGSKSGVSKAAISKTAKVKKVESEAVESKKIKSTALNVNASQSNSPIIDQAIHQVQVVKRPLINEGDIQPTLMRAHLLKERKVKVSDPNIAPSLLHQADHKSSQKKALQQLLNRSLDLASGNNPLKQQSQTRPLLRGHNGTNKPKPDASSKDETTDVIKKTASEPKIQAEPRRITVEKSDSVVNSHAKHVRKTKDETLCLQPSWGKVDFDVLLFSVAGLTLAVPLVSLGQIYPLNDDITSIFGQSKWYMGIKTTPLGKVHVVNTAMFVMPEKYQQSHAQNVKYVVTIDGYPWGLAVDKIDQPRTITQAQVKWRTERSKRAWLAGTIKSVMCGLIDVQKMGEMLVNDEKS